MGFLHEGHLALADAARARAGIVVMSVFVNPLQFGPHEDFSRYPRDLARDARLCRQAGADVIFAPDNAQMYPGAGPDGFSTYVVEETLSRGWDVVSQLPRKELTMLPDAVLDRFHRPRDAAVPDAETGP